MLRSGKLVMDKELLKEMKKNLLDAGLQWSRIHHNVLIRLIEHLYSTSPEGKVIIDANSKAAQKSRVNQQQDSRVDLRPKLDPMPCPICKSFNVTLTLKCNDCKAIGEPLVKKPIECPICYHLDTDKSMESCSCICHKK